MELDQVLHMVVGKWRTPNHSNKRDLDDSHKVKQEILKRIGQSEFREKVGGNPDIDITEKGKIILKGVGERWLKKYYETDISADDYFILSFLRLKESNETEIQILINNSSESDKKLRLNIISHLSHIYIIPNNEQAIRTLIDLLTEEYVTSQSSLSENYIILLK